MRPWKAKRGVAGYSGTPLAKKLGIRQGDVVGLIGAPRDFADTLGDLPVDVTLRFGGRGACTALVWFVRSRRELDRKIKSFAARAHGVQPWIAWEKGTGGVSVGVSVGEKAVREAGLAAGLVDFKICAIDQAWSGLRFARRKAN